MREKIFKIKNLFPLASKEIFNFFTHLTKIRRVSATGRKCVRTQHGSDPDPHGNDAPSVERRCEQIISKHHLVGGKITGGRERFHAIISWEKKAKPDPGKVCQSPNLFDADTNKPKHILNLHEMRFCTVCIFRNFSFLFTA